MRNLMQRLETLEAETKPAERRVILLSWRGGEALRCGDIHRKPAETEAAFKTRVSADLLVRSNADTVTGFLRSAA